ncbi:MAG: TM2 domain-containing protein [Clostridia bacterium]|nr:TM2 domain-containing protein [Clostridia bacterium]
MKVMEAVEFVKNNEKYFPSDKTDFLISKLIECKAVDSVLFHSIKFISPYKAFVISILFGIFGADRFLIREYLLGFIKLFTIGGFGFLLVFDWFYILKRVKYINYLNLLSICYYNNHIF